jgi:nucleoside-diphosphate-sugar epimerase
MENLAGIENKITMATDSVECYEFPRTGFDIVYHLAAHPWATNQTPEKEQETFRANVDGTWNVLRQCSPKTLLIFASTANLYGEGRHLAEESPLKIVSFYGYTKVIAEQLIKLRGIPYIIFRLGTVVGPRGRCFPNRLVWSLLHDVPLNLFNNGNVLRDIVDVRDVIYALTNFTHLRGTYNLGSNTEISGEELLKIAEETAYARGKRVRSELFGKEARVPNGFARESTLRTKLWNHPTCTLQQTMESLFNYYENPNAKEPPSWESL